MTVQVQDKWLVPDASLARPFHYLLQNGITNIDKFTILLNGYQGQLLTYLTEQVGLSRGLANDVKAEIGAVGVREMTTFTRADAMVLYAIITKTLKKKMPLEKDVPPVIMTSKTTSRERDAKIAYTQAKAFLAFLQARTSYLQ